MTRITHSAFFGDDTHAFALTDPMMKELERLTDQGIGALYHQMAAAHFRGSDVPEIIRLGLIGAGMNLERAKALTDTYARNRPLLETAKLAAEILDARWHGVPDEVTA